ncbi:hypothetical protein NJB1907f44_02750 [Mycobacterium marinum]|nr:hypothetical protein MMRN_08500 [Mycobacterium marinum]GJO20437.1 hypothetical protein NJB1507_16410 [Mycobacterium marinum]GJO56175.1 hypothetical protein NJB1728f10_09280 [Mycobacterium marinum]GJO82115.1 hypothetical protein NJB1907f44_02750 [Mycobacterium marinum]GJP27948.1 hypothetical protein NJB18091_06990 [Mycobacterium marinum]
MNTENAMEPVNTKPGDKGHAHDSKQQPHSSHNAGNRNHPHPRVPPPGHKIARATKNTGRGWTLKKGLG